MKLNERRRELARRARRCGAPGKVSCADLAYVVESADGRCAYGGRRVKAAAHFEHCTPLARGGTNTVDNLVMACKRCNLKKGRKTVLEFLFPGCNSAQTQFTFRASPGESRDPS